MEIFDLATTLISIIIGIGLTEMFGNLHRLIRNRARVRWDWLPVVWATVLLTLVVNYWWAIYQGIVGIDKLGSAAELGLVLIQPIVMFLLLASVLPSFAADRRWDMPRYYEEHRRTFIATFLVYQCVTAAVALVVGTWGWNPASLIRTLIVLLLVMTLVFNTRRWDWIGSIGILAGLLFRLTTQAA
jgi:hypothetical protein